MRYSFIAALLIVFVACNQQSATQTDVKDSVSSESDAATERPASSTDTSTNIKTDTTTEAAFQANKLIVAGKSIGNIELGMDDSKLEMFGKPDMSDAAMGKAWLTWYGKKTDDHNNKTELNVYTAYKDTIMRSKTVQQIRSTSSFFETANGIHVYSSLNDIEKEFPGIKKAATYTNEGRNITVYDVQKRGIAFEVATANDQQICTGIIIHKPGIKVTQVYISLHPDMHVL